MFHKVKRLFVRNSVIILLAAAFIAAAGSFAFAETVFSGSGSGTEEDPYIVSSLSELQEISTAVKDGHDFSGQYICLTQDIDLPGNWEPLGALKEGTSGPDSGKNINPFSGTFDGGGHTVKSADGGYALFGYVRNAVIQNLCIEGNNINGNGLIRNYVVDKGPAGTVAVHTADIKNVTIKSGTSIRGSGFVSGYASSDNTVDILNCTVEDDVVIGCGRDREKVGSFGGDFNGTVTFCTSAAEVYGTDYVGGIIGCKGNSMSATSVTGCTFTGKVVASGHYAGGIAGGGYGGTIFGINSGPNAPRLKVEDCHSSGKVTAGDVAGGIVGFETTVQSWENGKAYYRNNLFTGTVATTEGNCKGGLAGAFRGIDKYDFIQDNYYAEGCGADRGIGKITYVDTSCATHETTYGEYYFDTSVAIPDISVLTGGGQYSGNLRPDHNRTDDPLGADADSLAREVTNEELTDGSLVAALNGAEWSKKCWKQGDNGPYIDITPIPLKISVEDGYKDKYYIGEELDKENLHFTVIWSDGTNETIDGNSEDLTITGFDSTERAFLTLRAKYKSVAVSFGIKIISSNTDSIRITFLLLGDRSHGMDEETIVHTKSRDNLQKWFKRPYLMTENDTVYDLIVKALGEEGLSFKGSRTYISGIQIPGTNDYLMEKANGVNSGWMYSIGDTEPSVSVGEYYLSDGMNVVLFYTDDFTLERSTFSPEEVTDRLKAEDVADLIKALPKAPRAKLSDKAAAEHARDEYKKLTGAQKEYISEYLKKKLSDVLARVAELKKKVIYKGKTYKVNGSKYKVTVKAGTGKHGKVTAVKMRKAKKSVIPAYVTLSDGRKYDVTIVAKRAFTSTTTKVVVGKNVKTIKALAFTGSKTKTVYLRTKTLKKASVKGCLKKSKVKTIKVTVGNKKLNKKYKNRYKKIFTKKITGRKVTVR